MLVIAHRGNTQGHPENSLSAFESAVSIGCERIELDIHKTKDNHLVVIHDEDLSRVAGKRAKVQNLTRAEIGALSLQNGERIPFLDDVLVKFLDRIQLNIEIKGQDTEVAVALSELLKGNPRTDDIVVSAFCADQLQAYASAGGKAPIACLFGGHPSDLAELSDLAPDLVMSKCNAKIIHPHVELVDSHFADHAKWKGWTVIPWVPMKGVEGANNHELWAKLKVLGVAGLCTNYPEELRKWVDEQN